MSKPPPLLINNHPASPAACQPSPRPTGILAMSSPSNNSFPLEVEQSLSVLMKFLQKDTCSLETSENARALQSNIGTVNFVEGGGVASSHAYSIGQWVEGVQRIGMNIKRLEEFLTLCHKCLDDTHTPTLQVLERNVKKIEASLRYHRLSPDEYTNENMSFVMNARGVTMNETPMDKLREVLTMGISVDGLGGSTFPISAIDAIMSVAVIATKDGLKNNTCFKASRDVVNSVLLEPNPAPSVRVRWQVDWSDETKIAMFALQFGIDGAQDNFYRGYYLDPQRSKKNKCWVRAQPDDPRLSSQMMVDSPPTDPNLDQKQPSYPPKPSHGYLAGTSQPVSSPSGYLASPPQPVASMSANVTSAHANQPGYLAGPPQPVAVASPSAGVASSHANQPGCFASPPQPVASSSAGVPYAASEHFFPSHGFSFGHDKSAAPGTPASAGVASAHGQGSDPQKVVKTPIFGNLSTPSSNSNCNASGKRPPLAPASDARGNSKKRRRAGD